MRGSSGGGARDDKGLARIDTSTVSTDDGHTDNQRQGPRLAGCDASAGPPAPSRRRVPSRGSWPREGDCSRTALPTHAPGRIRIQHGKQELTDTPRRRTLRRVGLLLDGAGQDALGGVRILPQPSKGHASGREVWHGRRGPETGHAALGGLRRRRARRPGPSTGDSLGSGDTLRGARHGQAGQGAVGADRPVVPHAAAEPACRRRGEPSPGASVAPPHRAGRTSDRPRRRPRRATSAPSEPSSVGWCGRAGSTAT